MTPEILPRNWIRNCSRNLQFCSELIRIMLWKWVRNIPLNGSEIVFWMAPKFDLDALQKSVFFSMAQKCTSEIYLWCSSESCLWMDQKTQILPSNIIKKVHQKCTKFVQICIYCIRKQPLKYFRNMHQDFIRYAAEFQHICFRNSSWSASKFPSDMHQFCSECCPKYHQKYLWDCSRNCPICFRISAQKLLPFDSKSALNFHQKLPPDLVQMQSRNTSDMHQKSAWKCCRFTLRMH